MKKQDCWPIANLSMLLTQSCNLDCVYCYGNGGKYGHEGSMDEVTAYRAVDWLIGQSGKVDNLTIGFFGGEPFLRFPLMQSLVLYARKKAEETGKSFQFHVTTNGTLLDEAAIQFIRDNHIAVMVSVDGPSELHDLQRPRKDGSGSYQLILPKVKRLLSEIPSAAGHAVLMEGSAPDMVRQSLLDLGFTEVSLSPATQARLLPEENGFGDSEAIRQALDFDATQWINAVKKTDLVSLQRLKQTSDLYQPLALLYLGRKRYFPCGAGLGMAAVSASGDLFLCHRFVGMEEFKIGSVFHQEEDPDAAALRSRSLRSQYWNSPTETEFCRSCEAKYYCAGGCKHDNLTSCGSIFKQSLDKCQRRRQEWSTAVHLLQQWTDQEIRFLVESAIFPPKPCPLDF